MKIHRHLVKSGHVLAVMPNFTRKGGFIVKRVLAFDFGASSGRAMLGSFDGEKIQMEEIHRFSNDTVTVNGTFYWDTLRLFFEIKRGISLALQKGGFDAIGIDTWGVDFGMLDKKGRLLGAPVHYRDARTEGMPEEVFKTVSQKELYARTGIQFMRINTLYQLYYLTHHDAELFALCDKILLTPDLFAYFLTGEMRGEMTNASTTNLMDAKTKTWDTELCEKLGIPTHILPEIIAPGEVYGTLSKEICEELGCDPVPVIAVATHDTASAVVATPAQTDDFVYISCGTWSLFGIESDAPILTDEAMAANFTNETGYNKTTRFLKNIMGLWVIQESRRQWIREGQDVTYATLEQDALGCEPFRCFIDCDDPSFEAPGNLPRRIQEFCKRTGQYVPQTRGEIMRCIYQSLAMKYRYTFESLKALRGRDFASINVIGGGTKDNFLCQLTANATGVPVAAGPNEATVMGNIAVQLIALGEIDSLKHAREVVTASTDLKTYLPVAEEKPLWDEAYQNYLKILHA